MKDFTSNIKLSHQIFRRDLFLKITSVAIVNIEVSLNENGGYQVELSQPGKPKKASELWMKRGDTLNISHSMNIDFESDVSETLPLKINYDGIQYTLSETKNNKLILTK